MKQLFLISTLLILSACQNVPANIGATQPKLDDYSLGEKWVWKFRGVTDQGVERSNGTDTREVIEDSGALRIKSQYGMVAIADIVKPEASETPRYKWPLEVGKTWRFESHWKSDDGTTGSTIQDAEVLSFKAETVEAGTFMAYTITYKGEISNSHGYKANTEEVYLYAPRVKNFIKLTQVQDGFKYVEELIEYIKP